MNLSILSVSLGAAFGALLRWALGIRLNALFRSLPLGTLAANLAGGFLIGVAVACLSAFPGLSPQWRLFGITGFLGGLTTFSTFSAEVVEHLMAGRLAWAAAAVAIHVAGSLTMTLLGIAAVALARSGPIAGA